MQPLHALCGKPDIAGMRIAVEHAESDLKEAERAECQQQRLPPHALPRIQSA